MTSRPGPGAPVTSTGRVDPNAIYHRREAQLLDGMLKAGDAALLYAGVAVNLLALRHEICTVLVIEDPRWYERESGELRICDEFLRGRGRGAVELGLRVARAVVS